MQSRALIQRLVGQDALILPLVQSNRLPILGVVQKGDSELRDIEQDQDTANRRERRLDAAFRADEQAADTRRIRRRNSQVS